MNLYLTVSGLLTPLGYSQVVRPLLGLARCGVPYAVVSLERGADWEDTTRMAELRASFAAAGIEWFVGRYDERGGGRAAARNLTSLIKLSFTAARRLRPTLTHVRSYWGGLAGLALKRTLGVPYLFDIRGYWIDENLDEERWFTTDARLAAGRRFERELFRQSAAVVTLTEVAADDVRRHLFGRWPKGKPVVCIPTLVDYEAFRLRNELVPGRLVIGHVGSFNQAYRLDEGFAIARRVCDRVEHARVLCLTHQTDVAWAQLRRAGLVERADVRSVQPDDVAEALLDIDWGLVLRSDSFASRAAMPTKLGEYFAVGIRPIQWGGNADIATWVERAETGVTLRTLEPDSLDRAATEIAERPISLSSLRDARNLSARHFSLRAGVDHYATLISELQCAASSAW